MHNIVNKSIVCLCKLIVLVLKIVTIENIKNYFRKVRHYMFAYLEGFPGGSDLVKLVKNYKKAIMSHRRIYIHGLY